MAIRESDFVGSEGKIYDIVWDGWKGQLILAPKQSESYLVREGVRCSVEYLICNPQDKAATHTGIAILGGGRQGPGFSQVTSDLKHRIFFTVHFKAGPQLFDGYMMTQTRNAIAGITLWKGVPYGFYAIYTGDVFL